MLNQYVSAEGLQGLAMDVTAEGELLLRTDDGQIHVVSAGDIAVGERPGQAAMSRIRFEWNIESTKIDRSDGEDILAKRRRRRNVYILLFLICLLLATVAACGLFVRQRLIDVKNQYAQLLQDTVKAEVAALRIGDVNTFLNIQAEDEAWRNQQRGKYQDYSRLKAENEIDLTGNILSVEIDGELARVLVQENIKDLPYARLWFYQREESRWRHIAPDYSLWGAWQIYESPGVRVNYREADALFAKQLGETVAAWIKAGCAIFACPDELTYVIDVLPEAADRVAWSDVAARRLLFRSPYTDLARADMPFEGGLQFRASQLIAGRFVDDITGTLVTATSYDADFLRESVVGWLAEQFTRIDSGALLIRSLADGYGVDRVRQLLSMLGEAGTCR